MVLITLLALFLFKLHLTPLPQSRFQRAPVPPDNVSQSISVCHIASTFTLEIKHWEADICRWANIFHEAKLGKQDTLRKWLSMGGDYLCRQAASTLGLNQNQDQPVISSAVASD